MAIEKLCQHCGKQFLVRPYRRETAKFCSYLCLNRHNVKRGNESPVWKHGQVLWGQGSFCACGCGKKSTLYRGVTKKFIHGHNPATPYEHPKKENHWNWQGGITKLGKDERTYFKHTTRKQTLERDDFKCTICGEKEGLQVDHISPWAKYPELRFNLDNCRTLCFRCHYKITFGREIPSYLDRWGWNT